MPDLTNRSFEHELMDNFNMSQNELNVNLLELEIINLWLGGYAVSFNALRKLDFKNKTEITVLDIGCGGGDGMIAIQKFLQKMGVRGRMIGVDANPKAIEYARHRCKNHPDFEWIVSPFQELGALKADVWHCSLFAHHFYNDDLKLLAKLMQENAEYGFIINDLHRHWLAYHSISILTRMFSRSHLVKNDARLSVAKGFSKSELAHLFTSQNVSLEINWKWAFRWQVLGRK